MVDILEQEQVEQAANTPSWPTGDVIGEAVHPQCFVPENILPIRTYTLAITTSSYNDSHEHFNVYTLLFKWLREDITKLSKRSSKVTWSLFV